MEEQTWRLREAAVRCGRRFVILDDDPTGTQTTSALPVVTQWSVEDLLWALRQPTVGLFVLTNTRSMPADEAAATVTAVIENALAAAAQLGLEITIVLRGDSTLRGHIAAETNAALLALADAGEPVDGVVVCPAFVEAGRTTSGDVQWVLTDSGRQPVNQTGYARDAAFGYRSADLKEWLGETGTHTGPAGEVRSVSLEQVREGPGSVVEAVSDLAGGRFAVLNAEVDDDIDVLGLGLLAVLEGGRRLLVRSGPSLVRTLCGQRRRPPLRGYDLAPAGHRVGGDGGPGTLVVVGSHVELTNRQLDVALRSPQVRGVELDVAALLDAPAGAADQVVADAAAEVAGLIDRYDVCLLTSREVRTAASPEESLELSRRVAVALADVARRVVAGPGVRALIAKGGITSHDTLTRVLQLRRGWVLGQMLDGLIPVVVPDGPASARPCVIFPGNVGDVQSLASVLADLRSAAPTSPVATSPGCTIPS